MSPLSPEQALGLFPNAFLAEAQRKIKHVLEGKQLLHSGHINTLE